MNKALIPTVTLVLLGILNEWEKLPSKFLKNPITVICEKHVCNKAGVGVMEVGKEVLFFGDCLDEETVGAWAAQMMTDD